MSILCYNLPNRDIRWVRKHIGSLIRHFRKKRKLTLYSVSGKAGVSEGFLSQVENNVNSPSVNTLMGICDAIGVHAGALLDQGQVQEKLVILRKRDGDALMGDEDWRFDDRAERTSVNGLP